MSLKVNTYAIVNDYCSLEIKPREGERVFILDKSGDFFRVEFDDGGICTIKDAELNEMTDEDLRYMAFIYIGNEVLVSDEKVRIVKVDYLNRFAEVEFDDNSNMSVEFNELIPLDELPQCNTDSKLGKFGEIGLKIGKFTDDKDKQYGSSVDAAYEMMKVLMKRYTYDDENYLIPKSLVKHMLLQVRIMDKQNRIFNNPSGKNEKESPYKDIAGYGLIGVGMVEK